MDLLLQYLGSAMLLTVPWLYHRAALRLIEDHQISTTRNRSHPWKIPPAEAVQLGATALGAAAAFALLGLWAHHIGIEPPRFPPIIEPTIHLVPVI